MRNLWLHEEDREREMTVVRNEFERGENDPQRGARQGDHRRRLHGAPLPPLHDRLAQRHRERADREAARVLRHLLLAGQRDRLGDRRLRSRGGARARQEVLRRLSRDRRSRSRRSTRSSRSSRARAASPCSAPARSASSASPTRAPPAGTPDYAALDVLGTILGSGKTSRFYRALTDRNLTLNVDASAGFYHDPSLFQVYAFVAPGVEQAEVERVLLEEMARVKKDGVTDEEVATALAKYAASTAYGRDGSFAIASTLNESIAAGDWTLYYTLDDSTRKVTAADVKRVANAYLDANAARPAGSFRCPRPRPRRRERAAAQHASSNETPPCSTPVFAVLALGPARRRRRTASIAATRCAPTSAASTSSSSGPTCRTSSRSSGSMRAGDDRSPPDNVALATVTGAMLDKGTTKQDKFAIAQKLGNVGAIAVVLGGRQHAAALRQMPAQGPAAARDRCSPSSCASRRSPRRSSRSSRSSSTAPCARSSRTRTSERSDAFSRAVFPQGHPNRQPTPEQFIADIGKTTVADVRQFHSQYYGPTGMRIVIVGDVDPAAAQAECAGRSPAGPVARCRPRSRGACRCAPPGPDVFMPDKTSVSVVMGSPRSSGTATPMHSRCGSARASSAAAVHRPPDGNVRDKEGLTYGICVVHVGRHVRGRRLANRRELRAGPARQGRGLDAATSSTLWRDEGVTDAELARAKSRTRRHLPGRPRHERRPRRHDPGCAEPRHAARVRRRVPASGSRP